MDAKDNNEGKVVATKHNWKIKRIQSIIDPPVALISVPVRDSYGMTGKLSRGNELSDGSLDRP